ncbi:MAG: ABC transporter ATP-binding protein [Actinomycetota bacterium]|nr:ABC transporter ATP-binding protein [Actinomycetota bacterium]
MSLDVAVSLSRDAFTLDVSFSAAKHETVALLGPNGAGKTTLVSILAGLLTADSGRVVLDDDGVGRSVGVVFQDRRLFPHMTATDNVAFPLRARRIDKHEARSKARAMLERLGLGDRTLAVPRDLSGGEAQRVVLARALVHEPRLLLLDEPLAALDVRARSEIRSLLRVTLAEFSGVALLVTHDPVDALTLADRVVVLENGRITQEGTPEEIRRTPRTPYAAEFAGLNLFTGALAPVDDGSGLLTTPDGEIVVAWPDAPRSLVPDAAAIVHPADVSLFLDRPEGSARNVFRGPVAALSKEGDRVRVRLATHPALVAELTAASAARLALREGTHVWASFKALEAKVVS